MGRKREWTTEHEFYGQMKRDFMEKGVTYQGIMKLFMQLNVTESRFNEDEVKEKIMHEIHYYVSRWTSLERNKKAVVNALYKAYKQFKEVLCPMEEIVVRLQVLFVAEWNKQFDTNDMRTKDVFRSQQLSFEKTQVRK